MFIFFRHGKKALFVWAFGPNREEGREKWLRGFPFPEPWALYGLLRMKKRLVLSQKEEYSI